MPLNSAASGDFEAKRPANPRAKLVKIAGRIHIEKINGPFLIQSWRQPGRIRCRNETRHGGWLVMHESGTFVRFTQAGADLFA